MKHLLTIAGSDSSGGAGIQADIKTFSALGTYGMSVICAVTAQNTCGVREYQPIAPELIAAQIDAVFEDIRVDAVKVGMLGGAETIGLVSKLLKKYSPSLIIIDPVMTAKSGHRLLEPEAEETLMLELLPLATLITPNIPEAETLWRSPVRDHGDMICAAEALRTHGARAVLVKGGHLDDSADDVLADAHGTTVLRGERLDTVHTHGTGCSLSSAIAAFMSRGLPLREAVRKAKAWVARGIREGLPIGAGCGPVHHFHEYYDSKGKRI